MIEFLKKRVNWKTFMWEMLMIAIFFVLSYWSGNNKFPHNFWFVPVSIILVGVMVLLNAYLNEKVKNI